MYSKFFFFLKLDTVCGCAYVRDFVYGAISPPQFFSTSGSNYSCLQDVTKSIITISHCYS